MTTVDLLIVNSSQVATCAAATGDAGVLPGAAIAIHNGAIAAVGAEAEITSQFQATHVLDAQRRAVCPGFVDAHTHVVYAGDRIGEFELKLRGAAYLDILAAGGGILSTVREVRAATVDQLVEQSLPRLRAMFRLGTTTAEVKSGYGLDTANELKLLQAIERLDAAQPISLVPTFLGAHTIPPEFAGHTEAYVDAVITEQIPAAAAWYRTSSFAARGTPFFIDVFCEKGAFSLEQSKRILEAGRTHGMRVKAHVDEFTHLGGAALAATLGAASIDHLDVTPPADVRAAAAAGTVCVVIPAVNFHLGSRHFADARAMIDSGATVALATDINPGSAPCPSMPFVMAIACRYQRLRPAEALRAATINAAAATGIANHCGSVEPGKQADLVILNHADYRHAMYEFGGNPVHTVVKGGKVYPNA